MLVAWLDGIHYSRLRRHRRPARKLTRSLTFLVINSSSGTRNKVIHCVDATIATDHAMSKVLEMR
jgi:hypothetical protein